MSTLQLAYSTATSTVHGDAWAAVDRMVAWAARTLPGGTADDLAEILPAGIDIRIVREAMRHARSRPTRATITGPLAHRAAA